MNLKHMQSKCKMTTRTLRHFIFRISSAGQSLEVYKSSLGPNGWKLHNDVNGSLMKHLLGCPSVVSQNFRMKEIGDGGSFAKVLTMAISGVLKFF